MLHRAVPPPTDPVPTPEGSSPIYTDLSTVFSFPGLEESLTLSFAHAGTRKARRGRHSPLLSPCVSPFSSCLGNTATTDVPLWPPQETISTLSLAQMFIDSGAGSVLGGAREQRVGHDSCPPILQRRVHHVRQIFKWLWFKAKLNICFHSSGSQPLRVSNDPFTGA